MARSPWRRNDFIYLNKKVDKKNKSDGDLYNVAVPYEYRSSGSVSISQVAVTFWITPANKRTPSAPVLKLWNEDVYYNAVQSTTADRIHMISFNRRANSVVSSLETALGKLRLYDAGSGSDINSNPFDTCFFAFTNDTGISLYRVVFTSSVHNILEFSQDYLNVSTLDPDVDGVPYYKLGSTSPTNFTNLYNAIDAVVPLPADKAVKFIFFSIDNNLTDEEVKKIYQVYWSMNVTSVQSITI